MFWSSNYKEIFGFIAEITHKADEHKLLVWRKVVFKFVFGSNNHLSQTKEHASHVTAIFSWAVTHIKVQSVDNSIRIIYYKMVFYIVFYCTSV